MPLKSALCTENRKFVCLPFSSRFSGKSFPYSWAGRWGSRTRASVERSDTNIKRNHMKHVAFTRNAFSQSICVNFDPHVHVRHYRSPSAAPASPSPFRLNFERAPAPISHRHSHFTALCLPSAALPLSPNNDTFEIQKRTNADRDEKKDEVKKKKIYNINE